MSQPQGLLGNTRQPFVAEYLLPARICLDVPPAGIEEYPN